ncbi:WhiB family transcriptional regulator [Nonomuraea sp. NPDC003709]|uniref:WhiB family transcriptional regulator n=1 Tax=unclassified Nonomuraea TaxID=2593643 RepID=UPI0033BD46FC
MNRFADPLGAVLAAGPACGPDTADLFTGIDEETFDERQEREQRAKAICRRCPALGECLTYSLVLDPSDGVWAGLSPEDRNGITAEAVA